MRPRLRLQLLLFSMMLLQDFLFLLVHVFSFLSSVEFRPGLGLAAGMEETAVRADVSAPESLESRSTVIAVVPVFVGIISIVVRGLRAIFPSILSIGLRTDLFD